MVYLYIIICYFDVIDVNYALEGFLIFRGYVQYRPRSVTGLRPGYIISGPWPEFNLLT